MTNSEIKELIEILKKEGCNSKKQAIEYLEGRLNMKEKERNEKEGLMTFCRIVNDILDCGMCRYEFTDTCSQRLERIKKVFKEIINERYGIKKSS